MDADASVTDRARTYLVPRARLVLVAMTGGLAAGVVLVPVLVLAGWSDRAGAQSAFALGTLVFGGGLVGWSGSAMAGRGFEAMQEHLDTGTNWTEADSRRAMARIGAFGFGVMLATGIVEFGVIVT